MLVKVTDYLWRTSQRVYLPATAVQLIVLCLVGSHLECCVRCSCMLCGGGMVMAVVERGVCNEGIREALAPAKVWESALSSRNQSPASSKWTRQLPNHYQQLPNTQKHPGCSPLSGWEVSHMVSEAPPPL
jgi:hypothetical protein